MTEIIEYSLVTILSLVITHACRSSTSTDGPPCLLTVQDSGLWPPCLLTVQDTGLCPPCFLTVHWDGQHHLVNCVGRSSRLIMKVCSVNWALPYKVVSVQHIQSSSHHRHNSPDTTSRGKRTNTKYSDGIQINTKNNTKQIKTSSQRYLVTEEELNKTLYLSSL